MIKLTLGDINLVSSKQMSVNKFLRHSQLWYIQRRVDVILQKMSIQKSGKKSWGRPVCGKLLRPPRKGSVIVIEFTDGLHEYVTTPVRRILKVCEQSVYYIQTTNSRYRMEVQANVTGALEASQR